MEKNNVLYKEQGIHVITAIFTVEQGVTKVLLVKRKNQPYKDYWILTGGALYNNEELYAGARREIFEKSGIKDIEISQFKAFGEVNRSPVMRMLAVAFIGVIDSKRVEFMRETMKTSDADWFPIDRVPVLGYDHDLILKDALVELQKKIVTTNILKSLFPDLFTIPELQKAYEAILNKKFDRRNFRKKFLSLNLIEDTNTTGKFEGNKPAKLYRFKDMIVDKNVF